MALEDVGFPLRDSLEDTVRTLAVRAHVKGLELACRIPPDVPDALVGDPGRLRQVVVNLAGNAIKFTEQGEIVVDVQIAGENVARTSCCTSRCATRGSASRQDKQQVIFEAFSQADTLHDAQVRRDGPGAGDHHATGVPDGRPALGGERGGGGQRLPLHRPLRPGRRPRAPAHRGRAEHPGPAGAGGGRQRDQPAHPGGSPHQLAHEADRGGRRRGGPGGDGAGAGRRASPTPWYCWTR